jgi:chromosome segregation protein
LRAREIRELSGGVASLQAEVARPRPRSAIEPPPRRRPRQREALRRGSREGPERRLEQAPGGFRERAALGALEGLDEESRACSEAAASVAAELEKATSRRAVLTESRRQGELALGALREARSSVLTDLEEARLEATEIRIAAAGLAERLRGLDQESVRLAEAVRERGERIARAEAAAADALRRIEEIGESLRETEEALALLVAQHAEGSDVLAKLRDAFQLDTDRLDGFDRKVRDLRHQHQAIGEQLSKLQVSETEVRLRLQHLADGVFDRYNVRLEDLAAEDEAPFDPEDRERRQADLRGQIERLGEVSVTAIEEYQELSERYRFLTEQSEDLRRTIESLQNAIRRSTGRAASSSSRHSRRWRRSSRRLSRACSRADGRR